jgi:hypothetical protein
MASWPLVREARSAGRPIAADVTGSPMWAAGIHSRAPISACPVPSRAYVRCTVLIPLATLPTHPRYCLFTPAVQVPALTWPVSSTAPTARPRRHQVLRAASSSPATANRRTTPIAAKVSQTARLSSRCVRSGVWSPARSAIVHPFCLRRSHITAAAYLPACSHGSVRAKHGRSSPSSSARFRRPSAAPILAAAAAFDSVVFTNA